MSATNICSSLLRRYISCSVGARILFTANSKCKYSNRSEFDCGNRFCVPFGTQIPMFWLKIRKKKFLIWKCWNSSVGNLLKQTLPIDGGHGYFYHSFIIKLPSQVLLWHVTSIQKNCLILNKSWQEVWWIWWQCGSNLNFDPLLAKNKVTLSDIFLSDSSTN